MRRYVFLSSTAPRSVCNDAISFVQTLVSRRSVLHAAQTHRAQAGNPTTFAQTCSGSCYNDYVLGPPSTYDNAYFEIRSVRDFGTSSAVVVQASSNGAGRASAGALGLAGLTAVLVLYVVL